MTCIAFAVILCNDLYDYMECKKQGYEIVKKAGLWNTYVQQYGIREILIRVVVDQGFLQLVE